MIVLWESVATLPSGPPTARQLRSARLAQEAEGCRFEWLLFVGEDLKAVLAMGFLLYQSKSGLTSAPRAPHAWEVNLGSRSDRRTSSGHRSPLIEVQCEQR